MNEQTQHRMHDESIRRRLAAVVGPDRLDAAMRAYEDASIAGLCHDGAWEIAVRTAVENGRNETA